MQKKYQNMGNYIFQIIKNLKHGVKHGKYDQILFEFVSFCLV